MRLSSTAGALGRLLLGIQTPGGQVAYDSKPMLNIKHLGRWTHLATVYDSQAGRVTHYIESTGGILYSADQQLCDQTWLDTNVRFDHGPLGALCPLRKGKLGEADSETFLGLIPNGLSEMEHPDWGGWGGRFQLKPGSQAQWIDLESNLDPDTLGSTISRWALHFQNDYQARMDWCVKPYADANHAPVVVLAHARELSARPGDIVMLSTAAGSSDLDGDPLSYNWWQYREAGSYGGAVIICDATK